MQSESLSIATATDGCVACLVRPWQHQGRRSLTVVVKATFSMKTGGPMAPGPVVGVLTEDRTFGRNPTKSVEYAAESAPFLGKCDVLLHGCAYGGGRPSSAARLAVFRDRTALLDRTVHVFGERDAAGTPRPFDKVALTYERAWGGPGVEGNPVGSDRPSVLDPQDARKPACFGPVSRFWPGRKRLAAQKDVSGLFAAPGLFVEVPEGLSWGYFQAAPPEQQIEYLRGDEWVVLDGMSGSHGRVEARLPGARAAARVRGGAGEAAVALAADMLVIDAEKLLCSVVWRGRWDMAGEAAGLSRVEVAAGLELPGKVVQWEALWAQVAAAAAAKVVVSAAVGPFDATQPAMAGGAGAFDATQPGGGAGEGTVAAPAGGVGEATLGLSPWEQASRAAKPVAPFAVAAPGTSPSPSLKATPWSGEAPAPLPAAPVGEGTLGLEASAPVPPPPVMLGLPTAEPLPVTPMPAPLVREVAPVKGIAEPVVAPAAPAPEPVRAAPPPKAAAAPAPPPPPPPPPIIEQLRAAGAKEKDLMALMRALGAR